MHNLDWNDLKFVLAVSAEGSVNAAASALGVNHATVLRRIAAFEDQTRVTIFERHTRGYRVLNDAEVIIDAIRAVDSQIDRLNRVLAGFGAALEGQVSITSTDSLCDTVLPDAIAHLKLRHPSVHIHLLASNRHVNLAKLDAELSVRPAMALPENISGIAAGQLGFAIYGTDAYWAGRLHLPAEEHHWFAPSALLAGAPPHRWMDRIPESRIIAHADSFVTLARLAETGNGLAFVPICVGETSPSLRRSPELPDQLETNLWVAAHSDLLNTPRIRAIAEALAERLVAAGEILSGKND